MSFASERICKRIEQALLAREYEEEKARDIAFHMTDWFDDLEELNGFYEKPDALNDKKIEDLLIRFLAHVPDHLNAAEKLLTGFGVSDVFGVGVLEDDVEDDEDLE